MLAQHSSKSNEHYTPRAIVEAARDVMRVIHLDPATTAEVNANVVRAHSWHTKDDDGLSKVWQGNVFLNPPGGLVKHPSGIKSSAALWWQKLVVSYNARYVQQAIFVGFTLEIIRTTQHPAIPAGIIEFPCCFPRDRVAFFGEDLEPQTSPSHANVIAYLPDRDDPWSVQRFAEVFSKFGTVR